MEVMEQMEMPRCDSHLGPQPSRRKDLRAGGGASTINSSFQDLRLLNLVARFGEQLDASANPRRSVMNRAIVRQKQGGTKYPSW